MKYKDWEQIYKEISKEFSLPYEKEEKSAEILNELLKNKTLANSSYLKKIIRGKEVFIFGAGPSLEESLISYKNDFSDKIKIAADGATSALLRFGLNPDIIVTDLDGFVDDQINANSSGALTIIHAHGDNLKIIEKYVPKFIGRVIGTVQINPKKYPNLENFGGFTDGDRAVFLANHFNAKKINLIGFDFTGDIGKYSFFKKKNIKQKLKKLKWCEKLINILQSEHSNIFFF